MNNKCNFFLSCLMLMCYIAVGATQDANITIPLNKTLTYDDRELYGDYITLNGSSTLSVTFDNVNENISFIVFQAHSHIHNITVYNNSIALHSTVVGTNVGLVSFSSKLDTFYVYNAHIVPLRIYISVQGYTKKDPIPGGCNMEFIVSIAPYLQIKVEKDYIAVEAAQPSVDKSCSDARAARATFYFMYLPEMNFDADVYFDGIKKMNSINNIREYGRMIPIQNEYSVLRRILSAYPGTGTVFTAIANKNESGYALYVPTFTYACIPVDNDECKLTDDIWSQLLCPVLLFVGVFTCFFGHRFFKTEMFLAGFFSGVIITYIVLAGITDLERPALIFASTISGMFFGSTWLLFWWLYGIPVLSVLLPSLLFGFLVSSISYYRMPVVQWVLYHKLNFWFLFILVMLLTTLALVPATYAANILCCSVLGAFGAVYALDLSLGSNLKYIIINVVRRAVVNNFKFALIAPIFQWRDLLVTSVWVLLAMAGFFYQHYSNGGRPPFPPPPRSTRLSEPEARYGAINHGRRRHQETSTEDRRQYNERTALLA